MADELLCTLILASEKASKIARLCRESEALFSLLIQEKGTKHNEVDFKTLADVFIQQVVTKEVECKVRSRVCCNSVTQCFSYTVDLVWSACWPSTGRREQSVY